MPAARILGALLPLIFLIAVVGIPWMLRRERRNPTSFPRRQHALADWQAMPAAAQEAHDNAVLDAAQAAEDAVRRAVDEQVNAALAEAAKRNALFHP